MKKGRIITPLGDRLEIVRARLGINIVLGVGGCEKADSSTRINAALGIQ
jgi:hypothetical protein